MALPFVNFLTTFWQLFWQLFDNFLKLFVNFLTTFWQLFWQLFDNFLQLFDNFLTTFFSFWPTFWLFFFYFLTQCDTITYLWHHKSSNSLDPQMTAKGTVGAPTCLESYYSGRNVYALEHYIWGANFSVGRAAGRPPEWIFSCRILLLGRDVYAQEAYFFEMPMSL
jgi:hypothetical protein